MLISFSSTISWIQAISILSLRSEVMLLLARLSVSSYYQNSSLLWPMLLFQTLVPLQPPDILHLLLLHTLEACADLVTLSNFCECYTIGETLPIPSINAINPPLRGSSYFISMWSVTISFDLPQIWIGKTSLKLVLFTSSTVLCAASMHLAVGAFSYLLAAQLSKVISWRHSNLSIKAVQQQLSLI